MKFLTPFSSNWRVVSTVEDTSRPETEACFWETLGAMWFNSVWLGTDSDGSNFRYRATKLALPLAAQMGLYSLKLGNMVPKLREEFVHSHDGFFPSKSELDIRLATLLRAADNFEFEFFFGGFEQAANASNEALGECRLDIALARFCGLRRRADYLTQPGSDIQASTRSAAVAVLTEAHHALLDREVQALRAERELSFA
ncbi:hypothetical protein [Limnobacter litoralis]|uniref:Uncharacterized protein n=2 Tax=Limnobacter TaxID=131079 RepID=A0ABQ5YSS2_9BURK|nr:hypothetical protein [Limnobacter litoralis]GLR27548.1 hypothetical protein GCM10007875_26390 [Limnobacter litoralis]